MLFSMKPYRCGQAVAIMAAVLLLGNSTAQAQLKAPETNVAKRSPTRRKVQNDFDQLVPSQRTVRVPVTGIDLFYPPLVRGDAELDSGPYISVKARLFAKNNRIYRQIYMRAAEQTVTAGWVGPPSRAAGWSAPKLVYQAPAGWRIQFGRRTYHRLADYQDKDHDLDVFHSHIGTLTIMGDGRGDDIGVHTRVLARWNKVVPVTMTRRTHVATQ